MLRIEGNGLSVVILHPVDDRDRFGTRYCTGGYIFQVTDVEHGDLMAGPTWPDDFNAFDGQGIPDAFNRNPLHDPDEPSPTVLIPGIGLCDLKRNTVSEFCEWEIRHDAESVTMTAAHDFAGHTFELTRAVSIVGRTVRSHTTLRNTGRRTVPVSWFPHPFYPQLADTEELCRFNIPVAFPENDGFEALPNGFIGRKDWPWKKGHFQALDHEGGPLTVFQKHPKLGLVGATCSYTPGFFPIWGNANTFSWEPYYERTVGRDQTASWWIDYDF